MLKDVMNLPFSDVLGSQHVTGFNMKNPDGSTWSIKSPSPVDYAKRQVIDNQIAQGRMPVSQVLGKAGAGQTNSTPAIQGTGVSSEVSQQGFFPEQTEQPAVQPASFAQDLGAINPTSSSSRASSYGLSPEQLLAVEKGASEYVAQPIRNQYNTRLSEQLAESNRLSQRRVPWKVTLPSGKDTELELTPKEWIDYQGHLMQNSVGMANATSMGGYRAVQEQSAEALADDRRASAQERMEKAKKLQDRAKYIREMDAKGELVPGTNMTFGQADAAGVLDNALGIQQANKLQADREQAQRERDIFNAWRIRADKYAEQGPMFTRDPKYKGKTPGTQAMEDMVQDFGPEAETVIRKHTGAPPKAEGVKPKATAQKVPEGSVLVPNKLGPNKKPVWKTPDGQLYEEQ
jgi:hypothetical protein